MLYWSTYFWLILFLVSLSGNAFFLFHHLWKDKTSRKRAILQNTLLALFSIGATLLLIELFFVFFAQSDAFNQTLASKNWFAKHWQTNSLGYRDQEWQPEQLEGRIRVMVAGDSFVAGHGIENPKDRFPDQLGQLLGQDYAMLNVGRSGAETREEFQMIRDYPYSPDILILSFYINDIVDTATALGPSQPNFVQQSPPLVDDSYALNFIYWRWVRLGPQEWSSNYWSWLIGLYENPTVWEAYRELLLEIHDFAQAREIKLIVVLFPNLLVIEESQPITDKVAEIYDEVDVPVVDVADLAQGMEPERLVVNQVDWHANEFVHQQVAEALYQIITDEKKNTSQH